MQNQTNISVMKIINMMPYRKGKAFPLEAWTGPECSRRPRLSDFKTVGT
jgi:hypothetical protein